MRAAGLNQVVCQQKVRSLWCVMFLAAFLAIGTSAHAAQAQISPSNVNFGDQAIDTSSAPTLMTLTNYNVTSVRVTRISSSVARFTYSGPSLPVTLGPGQSLAGEVTFRPTAAREYQGTLVFKFAVGAQINAALNGIGVGIAPSITVQPTNQTAIAGQTATFSAAASGSAPLSYRWRKNGEAISGASGEFYTTPATSVANNGALFSVRVINSAGSVTSNNAMLNVDLAPAFTTQPTSQTVNAGQAATFSAVVTGTAPLRYQWSKNGLAINGAMLASYTTPTTVAGDNGTLFSVAASDPVGNVTSNNAMLNVNLAPAISTQPTSQTVNAGQAATFSVFVTGTAPLSYQWSRNGDIVSGATAASYTTAATTSADNGSLFGVTTSNLAGRVTSTNVTLTVNAAPTYTLSANPSSLALGNVDTGGSNSLEVTLTNSGNANVAVSNVSITGAGFGTSGVASGQVLAPAQTATLNVSFTPAATGSVTGNVIVSSNASNSPTSISLTGTGVQVLLHQATLSWTASTSVVIGYNIHRAAVSGGPYTKQNSAIVAGSSYVDTSVQSGQEYFYVATAVDSDDVEGTNSNEAAANIP
jgi:hypothetical protein